MQEKLKQLGTDTAIYGISTVVGRFLTFLLTPIYVNILIPADVGIIATVFAYIAFLNVLYSHGMDAAYMRFVSDRERGDEKQTFTTPFLSVAGTSLVFSLIIAWSADTITSLIDLPPASDRIIVFASLILLLDALALVPFAALRMQRRAKHFASIKMIGIGVNVIANILFLIKWKSGVEGVFLSGAISSGLTLMLLVPTIAANLKVPPMKGMLGPLLRFGLPYVPAGLAAMAIQVIDRPILEALTDKATVGIYQANYRLGIFMMLIVSMFDFAWRPFFLSHAKDTDAKQVFSRVLTYFVAIMGSVFVFVVLFIDDVVKWEIFWGKSILPEPYWGGLAIVPVILLAYMFLGMSNNFVSGLHIKKKTQYLPVITFVGAVLNIAANLLLIPLLGIMGAAIATLVSYATMAIGMYLVSQKFYPMQYDFRRIGAVALSMLMVFALYTYVPWSGPVFGWKVLLLILFGISLHYMKLIDLRELSSLLKIRDSSRKEM